MARGWILRTALIVFAIASCSEEPAPVKTAKEFANAVQSNDVEGMLELVDANTVAFLGQSAERASDQIGGRRSVDPEEMLQIVDVDRRFAIASAELVDQTDTRAHVRLVGADGTEHMIELVFEQESWRVRLSLPPAAGGAEPEPAAEL